ARRGQPGELAVPAHDEHAQLAFEPADPCGQRRLGHVAGVRGPREVPLPGERDQVLQLAQQHGPSLPARTRPVHPRGPLRGGGVRAAVYPPPVAAAPGAVPVSGRPPAAPRAVRGRETGEPPPQERRCASGRGRSPAPGARDGGATAPSSGRCGARGALTPLPPPSAGPVQRGARCRTRTGRPSRGRMVVRPAGTGGGPAGRRSVRATRRESITASSVVASAEPTQRCAPPP